MRPVKILTLLVAGLLSLVLTACDDDIKIHTGEAFGITRLHADVTCSIESEDNRIPKGEYGVLYSTNKHDIENKCGIEAKTTKLDRDDCFTVSMMFTKLSGEYPAGTRFYYRGYARIKNQYYYGDIRSCRSGQEY